MSDSTPVMDGFAMPAEWTPHARCWMAWPCRLSLWGEHYESACRAFAQVARSIAEFEPVTMLTSPDFLAMAQLQLARKAEIMAAELDDSRTRDTGPLFVLGSDGNTAGIAARFNGWGNKYFPHDKDADLSAMLLEQLGLPCYQAPLVLEGGAIDVDGLGTLLTTESCLLEENRNPTLDRRQVEERLALYIGARKIIWLPQGLVEDETDGHIDNVARFVAPGKVVCAVASTKDDRNHEPLQENAAVLRQQTDARGEDLEVIELPLPAPRPNGQMPLSYLNFYIANGAVVVPAFDDAMDEPAAKILAELFSGREIVQLPALDIVRGGGGIHCITQQQPAGAEAGRG